MAASINSGPNEWFGEWMKLQQNYWDSWAQMAQKAAGSASTGAGQIPDMPDWTQAYDQWWKTMAPYVMPQHNEPVVEMMQRVMEMGKNFNRFAEQGYVNTGTEDAQEFISGWLTSMEDLFSGWIGQLSGDNRSNIPDWLGFNKNMLDTWDHFASQLTSGFDFGSIDMPGMLKGKEELDRLLNTPALGQWREHQHQMQQIAKRAVEYQEADLAYKLAFAKSGLHGVEELRKRLQSMAVKGEKLESFRELYELWVEVNEAVYADFALTDEYQVIYGDLTNSLMALRKEINVFNEKIHKAMNIPTRTEINTINMRLQEQRRETRQLRAEVEALTRQLHDLHQPKKAKSKKTDKTPGKKKQVAKKEQGYDNLCDIKGIGPKMAEKLYVNGIRTLAQIAEMTSAELQELDATLNANGKVMREHWARQAKQLLGL